MATENDRPLVSVVIPAYNESRVIEYTIADIQKVLQEKGIYFEIIVVDDGSADLTGKIAEVSGAKVLQLKNNVGYGRALIAGLNVARGEIIVITDADGSYRPEDIERLIEPIRNRKADVVYGTRFVKASDVRPYSMSLTGYITGLLIKFSLKLLTGVLLSDIFSNFKAIRKEALEKLDLNTQNRNADALSIEAIKKRLSIAETPVTFRARVKVEDRSVFQALRKGFRIYSNVLRSVIYG
jgi:glycosyltransferase involved in cell wall biosynthesis